MDDCIFNNPDKQVIVQADTDRVLPSESEFFTDKNDFDLPGG